MARFICDILFLLPFQFIVRRVVPLIMFLISFMRRHRHLLWSWPNTHPELNSRVALFIHFDRTGAVQVHVMRYLASLRNSGCSVLFVSNAERLRPDALEAIKPLCDGILIRRNIGYDFAAIREGLEYYKLPRTNTEMLIIVNDSVYGPFSPLDIIFDRINFCEADIWGATDSWQHRYHLQSYMLIAGPNALRHEAWNRFWSKVRPVSSKDWVIHRYEVGFTQWMLRAGLRCSAIWPYLSLIRSASEDFSNLSLPTDMISQIDPMAKRRMNQILAVRTSFAARTPMNPTAELWKALLRRGFPFIKRELLRDNPGRIDDLVDWQDEVALIDPTYVEIIEMDLKRTLRHTAP